MNTLERMNDYCAPWGAVASAAICCWQGRYGFAAFWVFLVGVYTATHGVGATLRFWSR